MISGFQQGPDRLGQDVEIHGGGRAQGQFVRIAVQQAGHGPVAGLHGLAGLDGSLEGAVGLDLGELEKFVEAVDYLAGDIRAAGVFEHRPTGGVRVGKDRVLGTDEVDV